MKEILDLRKISNIQEKKKISVNFERITKVILVILISVILTTLGVKAVDKTHLIASLVNTNQIESQRCPFNMVFVPSENRGFCIDKYENSPAPKCPFQNPQSQEETRKNLENTECYPVSKENSLPWTNISQNQAQLACAKAGKRLPTAKEWYLASLGTQDKDKEWGRDDCNLNKNWEKSPGLTGSGKNCHSSFDVFDMIGNVWELVEETVFDGVFKNHPLPKQGFVQAVDENGLPVNTDFNNPNLNYNKDYFWIYSKGGKAIARGGYWNSGSDAGIYSSSILIFPSDSSPGIGFRCAK